MRRLILSMVATTMMAVTSIPVHAAQTKGRDPSPCICLCGPIIDGKQICFCICDQGGD
jgi:hypothetical protein